MASTYSFCPSDLGRMTLPFAVIATVPIRSLREATCPLLTISMTMQIWVVVNVSFFERVAMASIADMASRTSFSSPVIFITELPVKILTLKASSMRSTLPSSPPKSMTNVS